MAFDFFGKKKAQVVIDDLDIRFNKECRHFGRHGYILATNIAEGVINREVGFVIVGVQTAPLLDLRFMQTLTHHAEEKGWVIHGIVEYEGMHSAKPPVTIPEELRSEDLNPGSMSRAVSV